MSFHVKSFFTLLFTIANIAVRGAMAPRPPGSAPDPGPVDQLLLPKKISQGEASDTPKKHIEVTSMTLGTGNKKPMKKCLVLKCNHSNAKIKKLLVHPLLKTIHSCSQSFNAIKNVCILSPKLFTIGANSSKEYIQIFVGFDFVYLTRAALQQC